MNNNDQTSEYTSNWGHKRFIRPLWEPTPFSIVRKMLELAQVRSGDIVYDLGSGDARIPIIAVQEYGAEKAVGYEINPSLREQSILDIKRKNLHYRIRIINDDLTNADISEATVITLFLSMDANECLASKLEKEAKPSTRVVSYFHPIRNWQANKTDGPLGDRLYLYVVPDAYKIELNNS